MLIDSIRLKRNLKSLIGYYNEDNIIDKATNLGITVSLKMVEVEEERTKIKAHKGT